MNCRTLLFPNEHASDRSSQGQDGHSRTPSLWSTISTASSSTSDESLAHPFNSNSTDSSIARHPIDQTSQELPQTPLTARPILTRTTSLPPLPPSPSLVTTTATTTTTSEARTTGFTKFDKLFTSTSTFTGTAMRGSGMRMHRRTVSSVDVGQSKRTYRFGGKVFVPLRMDVWQEEDKGIKVLDPSAAVGVEEAEAESSSSIETEVIDRMKGFTFPAHSRSDRSPSLRNPLPPLKRIDRTRTTCPYPCNKPAVTIKAPAIIYKRSTRPTRTDGEIVSARPLPPALQNHLYAPERKIILVGPAICQHLQNGGSVRVKDFTGAVVGWMH